MHLKPGSIHEFRERIENDVIPALRKQKGFQNELTFVAPSGREVFTISLWDGAESAEAHNRSSYSDVTEILAPLVEGTPDVETETFDVADPTFHEIAAAATA